MITFGRYEGTSLRQLAEEKADYLEWFLGQDFPRDAKQIAGAALDGDFPEPPDVPDGPAEELERPGDEE